MSGIERYFRDYGYLYERLGNALSYLKDPREFFWKQKAKKEAAVLIQDPELAALQREAKEFFPEGQLYAKYTDFERYFAINLRRIYRLGLPSFLPSLLRVLRSPVLSRRGSPLEWIPFRGQKPRDFLKALVRRFSGKPWPQRFAAAFLCIGEVRWWERALSAEI